MRRHFGASFACTAWVFGGIILSEPPRPPVTFAVVRQDGILIPFATFDGQWKNRWPEPSAEVEVPITTADVPRGWWPNKRPQIEWTLWEDGAPRRLAVTPPAWVMGNEQKVASRPKADLPTSRPGLTYRAS